MAGEVWQPIPGYEGLYDASNLGRIRRSFDAPHRSLGVPGGILSPTATWAGYMRVSLSRDGEVKSHAVHRLVLSAFCGPEPFEGAQAAHNNGDRGFNHLTNLRWATPKENQKDVDRHGNRCRGEDVHGAVLTEKSVKEIKQRLVSGGERYPQIAKDFGVSVSTIALIKQGKTWKHVK